MLFLLGAGQGRRAGFLLPCRAKAAAQYGTERILLRPHTVHRDSSPSPFSETSPERCCQRLYQTLSKHGLGTGVWRASPSNKAFLSRFLSPPHLPLVISVLSVSALRQPKGFHLNFTLNLNPSKVWVEPKVLEPGVTSLHCFL